MESWVVKGVNADLWSQGSQRFKGAKLKNVEPMHVKVVKGSHGPQGE